MVRKKIQKKSFSSKITTKKNRCKKIILDYEVAYINKKNTCKKPLGDAVTKGRIDRSTSGCKWRKLDIKLHNNVFCLWHCLCFVLISFVMCWYFYFHVIAVSCRVDKTSPVDPWNHHTAVKNKINKAQNLNLTLMLCPGTKKEPHTERGAC